MGAMDISTILILLALVALIATVVYLSLLLSRHLRGAGSGSADGSSFLLLQQQLSQLQQDVNTRLTEANRAFQTQHSSVTNVVRDVTERMSKVEEVSRQVLTETTELQKLQQILKNPKHRGVLGEYFLETLLKNALPPESFQMQYKFLDGEIVDAAVFIKDKLVPIDSKFSLENYNRLAESDDATERARLEKVFLNDLKERIKETAKYIRPKEGTMDFAFMFIPHEAIYFDLLSNQIGSVTGEADNIIQRAASKYHIIIVSPTSFLAYLQTVLQGLRALQIEEQAKEIAQRVNELARHLSKYEQHYQSLGKHLGTAVNQYNLGYKEFLKIDKDVVRITGSTAMQSEALLVDRPQTDD